MNLQKDIQYELEQIIKTVGLPVVIRKEKWSPNFVFRVERVENELYPVDSEALEEIRKYRIARVCGTGPLGRAVCKALESYNVLIGGFLTNESENAPTIFMGRSVEKIEEAEIPNDVIFIVIVIEV